ncbi:MAG: tRNA (adenosine(37)-N6)-threonylcarbamoyltransferase complex transferase subunit TsaD, partial [Polyangiaceae bacterium]|nr:tRNA (adenosine(37)-N6)-threonylcarbamoyltransferase complex transferase subunit TsaD [Polyangiaceae bacterium]
YGGNSLEMSFSGIKTFVAGYVSNKRPTTEKELADLCASFQGAIIAALLKKTILAVGAENVETVVLGGGVAANRGLRSAFSEACNKHGLQLVVPPPKQCTDNGAMIAYAGTLEINRGTKAGMNLGVSTHTMLTRVTRRGRRTRKVD